MIQAEAEAWERDDLGGLGEETHEQYALRDQAAELALISLALSQHGRLEHEEVMVDLDVASKGGGLADVAVVSTRRPPACRPSGGPSRCGCGRIPVQGRQTLGWGALALLATNRQSWWLPARTPTSPAPGSRHSRLTPQQDMSPSPGEQWTYE